MSMDDYYKEADERVSNTPELIAHYHILVECDWGPGYYYWVANAPLNDILEWITFVNRDEDSQNE